MEICNSTSCTGCGMCSNICPVNAITMKIGKNDFVFPSIDETSCINCQKCVKNCPINQQIDVKTNVRNTYAAWNKNLQVRKQSSSGGMFSSFAEIILNEGGVVVGVAMIEMEAKHVVISSIAELSMLNGSKYVQSNAGDIYRQVKSYLDENRKVLFSGTPCQNHALRMFLGREYDNLFQIDVVCHGVPSLKMLQRHINEVGGHRKARDIKFRYKDPFWDYSYVKIDFGDDIETYQQLTVDDDYFHLFNISYSIRSSCHECHYANTVRQGDITLADFWGYRAHNLKMNNYFYGISLVLVNSEKGQEMLDRISSKIQVEEASLEDAKRGQKCLNEPFSLPDSSLSSFWNDYNAGMQISELSKKYCPEKFEVPRHLRLNHLKARFAWIKKRLRG